MDSTTLIEDIKTNVIQGRVTSDDEGFDEGFEGKPATVELIEKALEEGTDIKTLIVDGLTGGMNIVGERFESGMYLIPDMLAAAEAVGQAMDMLTPHLEKAFSLNRVAVIECPIDYSLNYDVFSKELENMVCEI